MTELSSSARPHAVMWLVWALILVGLPMAVAGWESRSRPEGPSAPFHAIAQRARMQAIAAPPPPVEVSMMTC